MHHNALMYYQSFIIIPSLVVVVMMILFKLMGLDWEPFPLRSARSWMFNFVLWWCAAIVAIWLSIGLYHAGQ